MALKTDRYFVSRKRHVAMTTNQTDHTKTQTYPRRPAALLVVFAVAAVTVLITVAYMATNGGQAVSANAQFIESQSRSIDYLPLPDELTHSHPDSAILLLEHKLGTDQDMTLEEKLAVYNSVGASYIYQAQYDKALRIYYYILEQSILEGFTNQKASAYHNIGAIYYATRKYRDGVDNLLRSVSLFEAVGDDFGRHSAKNNLGIIYLDFNDLEKSDAYLRQAMAGFKEIDNDVGIGAVANHRAQYFVKKNIPDSALHYFSKAIRHAEKANHNYGLSNIFLERGHFYLQQGAYDLSIANYKKSDSLAHVLKSSLLSSYPKLGISRTYLETGDIDCAVRYMEMAREINRELQNDELEYMINEVRSEIYQHQGDIARAFYHYKLATEGKTRLIDQTEIFQLYNLEIQDLSREMEMKELEMERAELLLNQRKNTMYMIILASASLIIILSLLYYFYLNRLKNAQQQKLHQNRIRHSIEKNRAAMEAEIQERKRLGLELHDGLGPLISLTKLNVTNVLEDTAISPARKTELLHNTASNLDEVLREMKSISNNLAPLVLMERGLEYATKSLATNIRNLQKYTVNVSISGINRSLDTTIEHALYRTIQEVLNNIILHADATEISIDMLGDEDEITVIIEDNGKGFNVRNSNNGIGLKSAMTRIEGLSGEFHIDSLHGRGTIVTIILPLSNNPISSRPETLRPIRE